MAKLTKEELLAAIEREESRSYGFTTGELSEERAENIDYYMGRPFGNEIQGRSQVVLRDVADTIEWVMPSLMRVFMSGDEIVQFDPVGPEDEEQAKQETDYVNHVCLEQNDSFNTFYTWAKDGLIGKVGYVKFWYDQKEDVTKETYAGLTDEEFALLLQDEEVEPIEHTFDEMSGLHDVKVKRTNRYGRVRIEPVPPEEMRVSNRHNKVSVQDADFVQHVREVTVSDIRAMGYDISPDDIGDSSEIKQEAYSRRQFSENIWDDDGADESMRLVTLKETYIRVDQDGDGIAELRRVLHVGRHVLDDDDADMIPFCAWSPVPLPHQHVGFSYADLIKDLQLIRSTILRQGLDNLYLSNNVRTAINTNTVNLDDVLDSRPGGVVRVEGTPGEDILPLITPNVTGAIFPMLEYLDGVRENRTGITKYNQGLDANSLNKTATGITQIMSAAQQRIELIARVWAETGIKELFHGVHALILKHEKKEQIIRLRNKWVPVDPRQWTKRTDMTVSVGLGTGTKEAQAAQLMQILQVQREAIQIGVATPENIYNAVTKLAENAGFKTPELFFTDPSQAQQQEKPDPAQQQMQMKQAEAQLEAQIEQQKAQVQMELERMKAESQIEIERMKALAKIELEREIAAAQNIPVEMGVM